MIMKENGLGFDFCVFTDYDSSAEVRLYELGNYVCEPGYSYGPVIRPRGIIQYVLSGKGMLRIGRKIFEISKDQIFYIPAGVSAYYEADKEDPWCYKWLHIGGTVFYSALNELGIDETNPVVDVGVQEGEENVFRNIVDDIFSGYEREFYCIGKMYELMDYLKKRYGRQDPDTPESLQLHYVRTVIKYIQLKYAEPIHMEDIAGTCGLNRSYLTRLFHEATGYTIKGYLLSHRMNTAQKLLKETDYPVQYIAAAVGYSDIFVFSKAFKKYSGCAPSEFRTMIPGPVEGVKSNSFPVKAEQMHI